MIKYDVWIRCAESCPQPQPGGDRLLITFDNEDTAEKFAAAVRNQDHLAQVREVAV